MGPGLNDDENSLFGLVGPAFQTGYSVPSLTFSTFATAVLTWFFVTLLELQSSKKAVVLNLLFQDLHSLLKVIVNDPDFQTTELPQIYLPFLFAALCGQKLQQRHLKRSLYGCERLFAPQKFPE